MSKATEYVTPDGRARGWWQDVSRPTGYPMVGLAVLIPECRYWLVETAYVGLYGVRMVGHYDRLTRARMMALGGNGHVLRGHATVQDVRVMTRCNVLALTAAPHPVARTRARMPWHQPI